MNQHSLRRLAAACVLSIVGSVGAQGDEAGRTLIHAGRLVDGFGGPPMTERTIVVEGNAIVAIERGYRAGGDGDRVVDLTAHTVMPGLIDMHVHLTGETSPTEYVESFRMNPEDVAFRSAVYADRTLQAGFTTVRDVGGEVSLALRNAINTGWAEGPRIFAAGRTIATTGGHGDSSNGLRRSLFREPGPLEGVANGPVEARAAVPNATRMALISSRSRPPEAFSRRRPVGKTPSSRWKRSKRSSQRRTTTASTWQPMPTAPKA